MVNWQHRWGKTLAVRYCLPIQSKQHFQEMSEISSNNKRIAKNTVYLYARMLIVLFVSIYTTRVVLSALGVEDYGIYNVVCGFVSMFTFMNTTMSNSIQRYYNYELGKQSSEGFTSVYQTSLILQIILAAGILIVLEPLGIWYVNNKMLIPSDRLLAANYIFQFATVSLVFVILQAPYNAAIIAKEKMNFFAFASIVDVILKLAIVLPLPYYKGDKLILYGVLLVVVSSFNLLIHFVYAKKNIDGLSFRFVFHRKLMKSIASFSGWSVLEMFAWMTQGQGVNIVMNVFFGPIVNAARGVAMQIQNSIQGFCTNLVTAFRPQLVQSYAQQNFSRTKNMMFSMTKIMFLFFAMITAPFIVEIDYVLGLWLGDNVPQYTAGFTVLMLLSMYPRNCVMAFSTVVQATGIIKKYQIWSTAIILMVLPISYLTLELGYSPLSVYWVNLFICIVLFIVCFEQTMKVFPFSRIEYIKKVFIPCIVVTLLLFALLKLISTLLVESFVKLTLVCVLSVIITGSLSYALVFNAQEKKMITRIIKRKR